jgi:hypothetical protein
LQGIGLLTPELREWLLWLAPVGWDPELAGAVIDALREGYSAERVAKQFGVDVAGVQRMRRGIETHVPIERRKPVKILMQQRMKLIEAGTVAAKLSVSVAVLCWVLILGTIAVRQLELNAAVGSGAWLGRLIAAASPADMTRAAHSYLPGGQFQAWRHTADQCAIRIEGRYTVAVPVLGDIELTSSTCERNV